MSSTPTIPSTPYGALGAAQPIAAKPAQAPVLRVVRQVGHADKIWAVRFSHDGKYVATGSADRSFKVWDVATRQLLLSYDRNEDHVTAFDLLPTENTAIIGTRLGELYLLNLDSGERRNLETKSDFMTAITVSADGPSRYRGCARHRQNLGFTERASYATLDLKGALPAGAGFTPRGPAITLKTKQGAEVLASRIRKATLRVHNNTKGGVETAVISHDGSRLIIGNYAPYDIQVFDTESFKKTAALTGQHYEIADAALSPDGSQLVTCGRDATVNLWDLKAQSLIKNGSTTRA